VPLSEHEQRVLAELEESLTKADPRFAKNVRETTVYSHSGRRVRWGVLGFVVGLTILIIEFQSSILIGLVGVAIMFASAILIERNARRLGRASIHDLTQSWRKEDGAHRGLRDWVDRRRRGE
jgi:hypothetical protein